MNYRMKIAGFMLLATLAGCRKNNPGAEKANNPDLKITRFETDLFGADPTELDTLIPEWQQRYGKFFGHFNYVLGLGEAGSDSFPENLRNFVTDRFNYRVYKRTMEVFPDLDLPGKQLKSAFGIYSKYFPEKSIPEFITYVSGFRQTAITDSSLLAIGLDMYLGSDEELYRQVGVYNYLLKNMYPEKMVPDCMIFWLETEFPYNDSVDNLVSKMIYRGKLVYMAEILLPDIPDTILWGFTGKEMEFCSRNEDRMWAYLVSNKLLFNSNRITVDKYVKEAPFTNDFGNSSPGRAALWLGYRIVSAYMKKNEDVSAAGLMNNDDYLQILNLSSYNP